MMIKTAIILALSFGCAKAADDEPYSPSPKVEDARQAALSNLPEGWPTGLDCDGLLWSGLARAAGHEVDLTLARTDDGAWWRRQVSDGDCYPNEAQSSISRDMFVGLLAGLMYRGGTQDIRDTLAYAHYHDGVMGEGDASRTKWTSNIYGLYERAIGDNHTPVILLPVAADYEKHLQMVEIVIYRQAVHGELPVHIRQRAADLTLDNPNDALAQAMSCFIGSGRCEEAEKLVLDPAYVAPSYVRGPATAYAIHRAYAAQVLLYTQGE